MIQDLCRALYAGTPAEQANAKRILELAFPSFSALDAPRGPAERQLVVQHVGTAACDSPAQSCAVLQTLAASLPGDEFCVLFALQRMQQQLQDHARAVPLPDREALLEWLLAFAVQMAQQRGAVPPVVLNAVAGTACALALSAGPAAGPRMDLASQLLAAAAAPGASLAAQHVSWHILRHLVEVMDAVGDVPGYAKQLSQFRDGHLLKIATLAVSLSPPTLALGEDAAITLARLLLGVTEAAFAFFGQSAAGDTDRDELASVQLPSAWRALVAGNALREATSAAAAVPELLGPVLALLAVVAGTRRSLFANDARRCEFLEWMLQQSLACRDAAERCPDASDDVLFQYFLLAARLVCTYRLEDFAQCQTWPVWLERTGRRSLAAFAPAQWAASVEEGGLSTTCYYMVVVWERVVRGKPPPAVMEMARVLTGALVEAGLVCARARPVVLLEALDDQVGLVPILTAIGKLLRRNYAAVSGLLLAALDRSAAQNAADAQSVRAALAWTMRVAAAAVSARGAEMPLRISEHESIDAQITIRVVRALDAFGAAPAENSRADTVVLCAAAEFFGNLCREFAADPRNASPVLFDAAAAAGLGSADELRNFLVEMSVGVLQSRPHDSTAVARHVALLDEISSGLDAQAFTGKTAAARALLAAPLSWPPPTSRGGRGGCFYASTPGYFDLYGAGVPQWMTLEANKRACHAFFGVLARLLLHGKSNANGTEARLYTFLAPLDALHGHILRAGDSPQSATALRLWCSAVRATAQAAARIEHMEPLLQWLVPLARPLAEWTSRVATGPTQLLATSSLLKVWVEVTQNRGQRLALNVGCDATRVLMVREVCALVGPLFAPCENSAHTVLAALEQRASTLAEKAALAAIRRRALVCLGNMLRGRYVPSGAMALYGDDSFDRAIAGGLRAAAEVSLDELLGYEKLADAAFVLYETVAKYHVAALGAVDDRVRNGVLAALVHVLMPSTVAACGHEAALTNAAGLALGSLLTWAEQQRRVNAAPSRGLEVTPAIVQARLDRYSSGKGAGGALGAREKLEASFANDAAALRHILHILLGFVLHDELGTRTWVTGPPLSALFVMETASFVDELAQLVRQQPDGRQALLFGILGDFLRDFGIALDGGVSAVAPRLAFSAHVSDSVGVLDFSVSAGALVYSEQLCDLMQRKLVALVGTCRARGFSWSVRSW